MSRNDHESLNRCWIRAFLRAYFEETEREIGGWRDLLRSLGLRQRTETVAVRRAREIADEVVRISVGKGDVDVLADGWLPRDQELFCQVMDYIWTHRVFP